MTTFSPESWRKAGKTAEAAAEAMYVAAHEVITARTPSTSFLPSDSPLNQAALQGDALCQVPWHNLIASAKEGLTAASSKMYATGDDYATAEEANTEAASRFWEG